MKPACKTCKRRTWVWDGPTRVTCPACGGTGEREPPAPKPRTAIAKVGPRGAVKRKEKADFKADYVHKYSERMGKTTYVNGCPAAPCQTCEGMLPLNESDFSHKDAAKMGGSGDVGGHIQGENGTYSCRCCHAFIEQDLPARQQHRWCEANILNGLKVEFSEKTWLRLISFREKWPGKLY